MPPTIVIGLVEVLGMSTIVVLWAAMHYASKVYIKRLNLELQKEKHDHEIKRRQLKRGEKERERIYEIDEARAKSPDDVTIVMEEKSVVFGDYNDDADENRPDYVRDASEQFADTLRRKLKGPATEISDEADRSGETIDTIR